MLTFIEILIGIVVIVGVARYIIKGYSATGVLFVGGLILLIVSALLGHKVLPGNTASTGYSATGCCRPVPPAPVTPQPTSLNISKSC